MGKPEDVVDAGTRLMADSRINGRALAIGPRVTVDATGEMVTDGSKDGKEIAVWEAYADDFLEVGKLSIIFSHNLSLTVSRRLYSAIRWYYQQSRNSKGMDWMGG